MASHRFLAMGWMVLVALPTLRAGEVTPANDKPDIAVRDAAALAARIDQLIAAGWTANKVKAAPVTDDAEFLRRVYLDLGGRIPRFSEVRDFLDNTAPDRRQKEIEKLLDSVYYVNQFTRVWRSQILPATNNPQLQFLNPQFEAWLRQKLQDNVRYDELVRELLTMPVNNGNNVRGFSAFPVNGGNQMPLAFYQANEFKPENIAARASRAFLGVNLECAQCHNHPFGQWKRQQFWEFAAFFAGIQGQGQNGFFFAGQEKPDTREIKIPDTEKLVQARFLDGTEPKWKSDTATRATLAEWLTSTQNPYFARNAANRLWAHFFGIGLVEPVDEFSDENKPSNPELLDELARQLTAHDFDLKYLVKAITLSKTYQLQSAETDKSQNDPRLFAKMAVKGMTPEQLFDSVAAATYYRETQPANQGRVAVFNQQGGARAEFLAKFASQDKKTEHQTSILQALALMNGRLIGDVTSVDRSQLFAGVLDYPFKDDAQRIDTLYLSTLSRKPTAAEAAKLMDYVKSGGPKGDSKAALADVFWALLNSSEFILNH